MTARAVLHVTSLLGGGVDRHVRDIANNIPRRHLLWHTGDSADVVEIAGESRFLPLDREALERHPEILERWLRDEGVGIVHAHSVSRPARERAAWAASALAVPTIVTLHDILFLRREGFEPGAARGPDREWLAETSPFLEKAAAVIAPSGYIAGLARNHVEGVEVTVVPNGSPARATDARALEVRQEFAARRPRHVAAILGAIGPHKGAELLDELAQLLEGSDIAIVVIGYLDRQIVPGWRGNHLFVHGAYRGEEVAPLLAAYGAELALFPNPIAESFSYALSDAWSAGLPALVPPEGALAERVSRHGGGWLLPQGFVVRTIASVLQRLLGPEGSGELARVKSQLEIADAERLPALEAMTRPLDALYERYGIDPSAPLDATAPRVQELIAKNLDSALFRQELVRLADELARLRLVPEEERMRAAQFAKEAREWMAKLEADVASLKSQVESEVEARRALGQENVQLRIHKDAFDLLPEIFRKLLLKKILNARS